MENLITQWLIEQINNNTAIQASKNLELENLKATLVELEVVKQISQLELELRELKKQDTELKEQGKNILMDSWIKKFEALDWTIIQLNKKPWALVIESEDNIEEYIKGKTTRTIDKKQLKEDIKQWVVIEWVYIKEDYTLAIKHTI